MLSVDNIADVDTSALTMRVRPCRPKSDQNTNMTGSRRTICLPTVMVIALITLLLPIPRASAMPGGYLCHAQITCLNGGILRTPDNPFDFCRCHCPKHFAGLRCEFNRKFRRNNRLKRLSFTG
ncbi:hypothetical protein MAR_025467 [Mya arenaria]|uniref:EGF-like domain-containing protein n=1 Tax=Mya arenaria TaxID=6604 RepID=A0ABY7EMR3_MYAAR|nr:hypothetical protein MAR_025467 [Mya arenaria]